MVTLTHQERFKTFSGVFDEFTNRNIFELVSRDIFDELQSAFKVGKESNIFIAKKGKAQVIVKIYRIQNCDFKKMFQYIRQDPRFEFLKHHPRDIIFAWVQREYRNLLMAEKAHLQAPKALGWRANIVVEEMIGPPAPPLKDTQPKNPQQFFTATIKQMKKLYKGGLVHGDLSAFNILNHKEQPYFIDFSQATTIKAQNAPELLQRDCRNVAKFFAKFKIPLNAEKIFKEITS